jgi:hypothetical protein
MIRIYYIFFFFFSLHTGYANRPMPAQARLLTYKNEYTFDGVEHAPLMYKIIMHLATINSVATTQTLHNNLQLLGVYAATVSGDIDKLHNEFNQNLLTVDCQGCNH